MKITDKFVLFWSGSFSQWYESDMVIDNQEFNCNEQYMMYKKAVLFKDYKQAEKIMNTDDPKEQKALGRQVLNFNKDVWESVCRDIVFRANYAKFTQNAELYNLIMNPEWTNLEFCEASPYDRIWGIGLDENNPLSYNKETWQGTNWLGIAITEVRDGLALVSYND